MKTILRQLVLIFSKGYPTVYISIEHWSYTMRNGRCEYNNFQTLINHLRS